MNFSIKRKSGSIRCSERPSDLSEDKTFLDIPFFSSVCLVDDVEKVIIKTEIRENWPFGGLWPYKYSIEGYSESHHV